jgi:hypothetical protein
MRFLFTLALVAGALAFAVSDPIDLSYTIKIANVPEDSTNALYSALNGPPRWTSTQASMHLPYSVEASAHYTDTEIDSDAVWFGTNVPADWITMSEHTPYYWGNLNSKEKWSPGPAYVIQGGEYEVIPVRENFTDSSTSLDYYLMINRPSDPRMLRYRMNFGTDGPEWYWFGTGTQFWKGERMTGDPDVQSGHSFPIVKDGDAIAVVVRISGPQIEQYAGQTIKSAFKIGGSYVEQLMAIPELTTS